MWDLTTENIVQHIVDICRERDIAVSKVESDLGFGNGYLNPKKVSDMKIQRLMRILDYLNISPNEFFDTEARIREIEESENEKTATQRDGDPNSNINKLLDVVPELTDQQAEFLLPQVLGLVSAQKDQDTSK